MIRNIVFDMGQVLLRFEPLLFMERLGVQGEDRELLHREVFKSLEWARMDRGSLTDAEAAEIICRRVPERLHEAVEKLVSFWDRPILEIEGSFALVEELKALGYKIFLLSNASLRQHDYWPRVPASRFFDGTLISADVKLVKPQPEIYRLLFERFSLNPEECFFIDDAIGNVEGAFYCGMPGAVFHGDYREIRQKLREAGVPVKES
ncbi:MAG: HAD family phosphatase [Oscillospiraceae bacterium]|nr:HAD family phosphatase [Oscillospiraceae bacterium]